VNVGIVTPSGEPSLQGMVTGNDVTAGRWGEILSKLGHSVQILPEYRGEPIDVLVALHARKSAPSIARFSDAFPGRALIVALTGTDLYQDLPDNPEASASLERATHVVTLQPAALDILDPTIRSKTTVIYQSAKPIVPVLAKAANCFQACLVAHLRPVKDPLLAAEAAALLSDRSHAQIVHAGAAATESMAERASSAAANHPRYRWIGPIPHEEARLLIARSHLLLVTSRSEGGANVISEAIAIGVPVLATRVPGVEGFLGDRYPGYFPPGDAPALAELLERAEHDELFYRRLERAREKLEPLVAPSWELRSWQQLLATRE